MHKKLLNFLCSEWDSEIMLLISEDLRKIGTYILGIAFIAIFVQNDNIDSNTAAGITIFGTIIWFIGVSIAKACHSKKNKQKS